MREWRKTHKLKGDARRRDICRHYANVYLKRGKLTKQPCEICGAEKTEMHHEDHNKPLEVRWLCRPHHMDVTLGRICLVKELAA